MATPFQTSQRKPQATPAERALAFKAGQEQLKEDAARRRAEAAARDAARTTPPRSG
jgi:hypothetical protein